MNRVWIAGAVLLMVLTLWSFSRAPAQHACEPVTPRLVFAPLELPEAAKEPSALQIAATVIGREEGVPRPLRFMQLMRTGDSDNGEIFGALKDHYDRTLRHDDGRPYLCDPSDGVPGSGVDFTSLLDDPDGSGRRYMVSQFECPIGAYYMSEIVQEADGTLRPMQGTLRHVSQKAYHGGWTHCAGSKTPWESHLGSEEYEPDGRIVETYRDDEGRTGFGAFDETSKFFGGDATAANPYYWGWVTEVKIDDGVPSYRKHYAMGRFSHELAYVMPDNKTVYLSDDGSNVGFYMFVADHASNLNSGTLYAAKWEQHSSFGGGSAALSWINLGHASAAEVRRAVDGGVRFSDLFEAEVPSDDATCPTPGFTSVNTAGRTECLKLRTDVYGEGIVSRLESRRYAAIKGATTEFRKEEGITFDRDHNRLYVSMSSIDHGMLEDDAAFDAGGPDHIRLEANGCGGVYALPVASTPQRDSSGKRIASGYVVNAMQAMLSGTPAASPDALDTCSVDGIANPDNLTYMNGLDTLVIAEDSKKHGRNVVWAYDVEGGALQRVAVLPAGAEATSPYWYGDIGGLPGPDGAAPRRRQLVQRGDRSLYAFEPVAFRAARTSSCAGPIYIASPRGGSASHR